MTKTCENPLCKIEFEPDRESRRFHTKRCAGLAKRFNVGNNRGKTPLPFLCYETLFAEGNAKKEIKELNALRAEMAKDSDSYPAWNDALDGSHRHTKEWNSFVEIYAGMESKRVYKECLDLLIPL